MVRLSLDHKGSPISIREIAKSENISLSYLEQLFAKLRRGKLVVSVRGPGGGYMLAVPAAQISLDKIIDSVEETLIPVSCMDDMGQCACEEECLTHSVWAGLSKHIRGYFSAISIEDLTNDAQILLASRDNVDISQEKLTVLED
jgi:Rrf2 family iron-sulfur cluster assembly transcriptional regulator